MTFDQRINSYLSRVNRALESALPGLCEPPERLHEAMHYAVLNGGKRIRPLLVYATGETLSTDRTRLDAPAVAIELIHAFSLVHDDLPAMDDDDLRRGKPTVHRKFDEATAILAADALQPLAFEILAIAGRRAENTAEWLEAISVLAAACGSLGMTGGQSIDLDAEGARLSRSELERMHGMKTGRLIRASVEAVCCISENCSDSERAALVRFASALGLAFQVKDDILDVEGATSVLGKTVGADARKNKATWPLLFGIEDARRRCKELLANGLAELAPFGDRAEPLMWMAEYIINRGK